MYFIQNKYRWVESQSVRQPKCTASNINPWMKSVLRPSTYLKNGRRCDMKINKIHMHLTLAWAADIVFNLVVTWIQ